MVLRWLHKSWKYFWRTILVLLLAIVILGGAAIGLLQLDFTQNYLANQIEQQVEQSYAADLSIGEIDGVLPFSLVMKDVALTQKDSTGTDTLATVAKVESEINLWGLLQNTVRITGFSVEHPRIWLQTDEQGNLQFLEKRTQARSKKSRTGGWFSTVEIIAPTVAISNGAVYIDSLSESNEVLDMPSSFSVSNINTELFVEWNEEQRYINIESFSAEPNKLGIKNISLSGQIYSENDLLELNSFLASIGNSEIVLNGEIKGFDLYRPQWDSLLTAHYNLNIHSYKLFAEDFKNILATRTEFDAPFAFELQAQGTADSLQVDRALVGLGQSFVEVSGLLQNLRRKEAFKYELQIDDLNLEKSQIATFFDSLHSEQSRALANLSASGRVNGDFDSAFADVEFATPLGQLSLQAGGRLQKPYKYHGTLRGKKVDVSSFVAALDTTSLDFKVEIDGSGFSLREADTEFSAIFTGSTIDDVTFDKLTLVASIADGFLEQEYEYRNGEKFIKGSGWVDFSQENPPLAMKGNARNINLAKIFDESVVAPTKLDFDYNVEIRGLTLNRIQGQANLDIKPSIIGGDTVRAHQLYMDLNSPNEETRTFRFTSSLFDLNITGQLVPGNIIEQAKYWSAYLTSRFKAEVLLNAPADSVALSLPRPDENVVFSGTFRTKGLDLIKKYIPDFPELQADSRITFNVNTDGTHLLLSAEMQVDSLQFDQWNFKDSRTQLTASFRSDRSLKEFSSIDLQAQLGSMQVETVQLDSVDINFALENDSVYYTQQISSVSNDARFNMELSSHLSDSSIVVSIRDFFLGNDQYSWINQQTPSLVYRRDGSINFNDFRFQNKDSYFQLSGTLSPRRSDSLRYVIRDVHLDRISELVNGRISFGGILNGAFITKSLSQRPTIQGELAVNRFTLEDRLVGDVSFNSRYNAQKDRFDTKIGVITDSTKYKDYLESNDNVGQNIVLNGYFVTPEPNIKQDTLFYFDADFNQIDMWVIPLLLENIFAEMEGQASGEGYITGNFNHLDFHADFYPRSVFAKPRFVNANYFVNGHVVVDRQQGVILDSLSVIDTKGGSGTVWGTVDLNDFKPITYLDLTVEMDQLQFLNNPYDPDIPFFGNVSGTGLVSLTGSNTDLYLRTENPVVLTTNSEISIPLLEETELNKTGKFIRFVDSFDERYESPLAATDDTGSEKVINEAALEAAIESLTFSERFDLDLQFLAPNDVTVHLIFDPVTGEVLTAQGTGNLRITMQNQNVQMFGQYIINSGSYQFVTGEIISRELELMPGGSMVWQGEPDNARLDISAVYHARPNIATLTSDGLDDLDEDQIAQSVPVDLIVEINGTINSVENNYYFELPTSMNLSSSTLAYTISQINRNEQQKLLQATSILFTGEFIPMQATGNGTPMLGESLSRGSTVLNPLISNQVISPLLSNQINALLNSDVSRLDVDFNLNAYNEVDLGIALRLYNDRLVLRREGRITGAQSTLGDRIGDLNATYRIQEGLSLTAFHRQDQILGAWGTRGTQAGDVAPDVNGIGLEARVNFNTWEGLFNKIGNIFGSEGKEKEDEGNKSLAEQKAKEEEK